jgi:hypothetical protein
MVGEDYPEAIPSICLWPNRLTGSSHENLAVHFLSNKDSRTFLTRFLGATRVL